jgi:branched-chain amino acid transport system ATP-binding protein
LTKRFREVVALDSLDLHMANGEILGLMGPNGSGKTVLFDLICGHLKPTSGDIVYGPDQTSLLRLPPHRRYDMGIMRTYQHLKLFSSLSVAENCMVAAGPEPVQVALAGVAFPRRQEKRDRAVRERAMAALSHFGERLSEYVDDPCSALSYANRRRLEVARSLTPVPKLVLLDEPTAGMNPYETFELNSLIVRLRRQGISFLIIEHKLFFLEDLADRIIVLAKGRKIAEGRVEEIRNDSEVIRTYLGHKHAVDG